MFKSFVIALIFLSTTIFSQKELKSLVESGVLASFNFEFDKADSIFNLIIKKYPENPEGYFYLSQIHMWYFLGTKDEGELITFQEYTELALERIDNIRNGTNTAYINYLNGNLYLQKAMVAAVKEESVAAFFAAKSSYSYFEDALEADSSYSKAYLGLGLLEYSLSYVPGAFKWAISLAGLGSDKEKGYNNILKAAKFARTKSELIETSFHKAKLLNEYEGNAKSSSDLLESLSIANPENLLFRYQLAISYIDNRELIKAREQLEYIVRHKNEKFQQTVSFSYFLLGEIYFRLNQYQAAVNNLNAFLELNRSFDYSGIAYYYIAISEMFLNNLVSAKKNLILARNGNSDIQDDIFAERKSKLIYEKTLTPLQLELIRVKNLFLSGSDSSARNQSEKLIPKLTGDDLFESILLHTELCLNLADQVSAEKSIKRFDPKMVKDEKWLIPYSLYLKSWTFLLKKDFKKASQLLTEAKENNRYDFKDKIDSKLTMLQFKFKIK